MPVPFILLGLKHLAAKKAVEHTVTKSIHHHAANQSAKSNEAIKEAGKEIIKHEMEDQKDDSDKDD